MDATDGVDNKDNLDAIHCLIITYFCIKTTHHEETHTDYKSNFGNNMLCGSIGKFLHIGSGDDCFIGYRQAANQCILQG